ncbi:OmpA family protein [bacterium]|nr:OmpA family protein [bacterium]
MKWSKIIFVIILVLGLLASYSFSQTLTGVRPNGMGGAFTAISNDGNALEWNPAGVTSYKYHMFHGDYSRLFLGVDNDNLNEGFVGYVHHLKGIHLGLSVKSLFTKIYRKNVVGFTAGREIFTNFSVGTRFKLIMDSFNENEFYFINGEDENPLDDPVFGNGYGKTGFALDFGALYQPIRDLQFGVSVLDILEPDMALSPDLVSGEDNSSKKPMKFRFGAAYDYRDYLTASTDIYYDTQNLGGKGFGFALGVESWALLANRDLGLRTGYDHERFYAVGLSYRFHIPFPLRVDYSFMYPLSSAGKAGMTTHKAGLSIGIKPKERLPDMVPTNIAFAKETTYVSTENALSVEIKNAGDKDSEAFGVSLYKKVGDEYSYLETKQVDGLGSSDKAQVGFTVMPDSPGQHEYHVSVDDNGAKTPKKPDGAVEEHNEQNNLISGKYNTIIEPTGDIELEPGVLVMSKMLYINEEEAIVPVIYFDANDTKVADRYDWLLELLAERLERNKDAVLVLRGYYHPESDDRSTEDLAWQRAEAVKEKILGFNDRIPYKVFVMKDHDPSAPRVAVKKYVSQESDLPLVNAENRRVELGIDFRKKEEFIQPEFSDRDLNDIAQVVKTSLENNPLAEVIATVGENLDTRLAYETRERLAAKLPDELRPRIYFSIVKHDKDPNSIMIQLRGEEILYRAKAVHSALDYQYEGKKDTDIKLEADGLISNYKVDIVDLDGNVFTTLKQGEGKPPATVTWDWKDEGGNLISGDKKYLAKLTLDDVKGTEVVKYSKDTVNIEIHEEIERIDRILIVQFLFDEAVATSRFFVDRLEYVADLINSYATEQNKKVEVVVEGHTDRTGLLSRNKQLSEERSMEVYNKLLDYFAEMNNLQTHAQVENWLAENDIEITQEAYAWDKPYKINVWREGELQEMLLGDNEYPEGRMINRRVVIQIRLEKKF